MPRKPTALHLLMDFDRAPTVPQLRKYVLGSTGPIWLRQVTIQEVVARSQKPVAWLQMIANSDALEPELRDRARQFIGLIEVMRIAKRGYRALRSLGLL